ncbi:MAG: hypothetical protein RR382_01540, partial [Tannerellaceae bacterium]
TPLLEIDTQSITSFLIILRKDSDYYQNVKYWMSVDLNSNYKFKVKHQVTRKCRFFPLRLVVLDCSHAIDINNNAFPKKGCKRILVSSR